MMIVVAQVVALTPSMMMETEKVTAVFFRCDKDAFIHLLPQLLARVTFIFCTTEIAQKKKMTRTLPSFAFLFSA